MSAIPSLPIPKQLYDRVRRLAQREQRQVPDVVVEALELGLSQLEVPAMPPEWERESAAFQGMHADLLERIPGQYAAVFQGELVDHDLSFAALFSRVSGRFPDQFVLVRPVREEPEITYHTRSVRWE
jgi:hypothetical protein